MGNHILLYFIFQFVSCILQTTHVFSQNAAAVPLVTLFLHRLLGLRQVGMSSSTKTCITNFLLMWVFLVHCHVLHAWGKVSLYRPFGSTLWVLVLGIIAPITDSPLSLYCLQHWSSMGIPVLIPWLLSRWPSVCQECALEALLTKERDIFVIDASSWQYAVCAGSVSPETDMLCGGQWSVVFDRVERFVQSFERMRCRLVFIFDSLRPQVWPALFLLFSKSGAKLWAVGCGCRRFHLLRVGAWVHP